MAEQEDSRLNSIGDGNPSDSDLEEGMPPQSMANPATIIDNIKYASNLGDYCTDDLGMISPPGFPSSYSVETLFQYMVELKTGYDFLHQNGFTRDGAISFLVQDQERPLVASFKEVPRGIYDEAAEFGQLFDEEDDKEEEMARMSARVDGLLGDLDKRLVLGKFTFLCLGFNAPGFGRMLIESNLLVLN
jgi:hypothetical protein